MENEGVKRVFQRIEDKHKMQYTEYYGDGDDKVFKEVEDTYKSVRVIKKECVGYVQKREKKRRKV